MDFCEIFQVVGKAINNRLDYDDDDVYIDLQICLHFPNIAKVSGAYARP